MKVLVDILMMVMTTLIVVATITNSPLLGGIGLVVGAVMLMAKEGRRRF